MSNSPIRVFSVDDHGLLREGIAAIINSQPDLEITPAAAWIVTMLGVALAWSRFAAACRRSVR